MASWRGAVESQTGRATGRNTPSVARAMFGAGESREHRARRHRTCLVRAPDDDGNQLEAPRPAPGPGTECTDRRSRHSPREGHFWRGRHRPSSTHPLIRVEEITRQDNHERLKNWATASTLARATVPRDDRGGRGDDTTIWKNQSDATELVALAWFETGVPEPAIGARRCRT